jgi:hypothetical protein
VFSGDIGVFSGDIGVFSGDIGVFSGDIGVFSERRNTQDLQELGKCSRKQIAFRLWALLKDS